MHERVRKHLASQKEDLAMERRLSRILCEQEVEPWQMLLYKV
jgi:hypothetical protein